MDLSVNHLTNCAHLPEEQVVPVLVETLSNRRFLTLEYSPGIRQDLENLKQYLCLLVGGADGATLMEPDVMCVVPI